jgi:LysM repeat protein
VNSIRPLATVIILAVIGIGLYMVINTSEPIPPEDAAGALVDIPQIEDELPNLIDEGIPSPDDVSPTVPPFAANGELTDPPMWAPSASHDTTMDSPEQSGSSATGQLPPDSAAPQLPGSNVGSLPTGVTSLPAETGKNPFSTQIQRQAEEAVTPQEVTNPYASTSPSTGQTWGDIPQAPAPEAPSSPPSFAAASTPTSTSSPFAVARQAIEESLREGDLSQALLMLSQYCSDPQLTHSEKGELDTLLSQLAGTVIYSTQHRLEPAYRIQPGETLSDIAARYQVTPQLLAKINGLTDTQTLTPGTELKVVRGPFHAVYEPSGLRLVLDGRYAGRFEAGGSGDWRDDSWTVQQKVPGQETPGIQPTGSGKQIVLAPSDPTTSTEGAAICIGAPVPGETRRTVYVSAKDMNDLYDILTVGSRVTVRR